MAKHLGAVVIGTAGTEDGMQAIVQNGASRVLNHRQPRYLELEASSSPKVLCTIVMSVIFVIYKQQSAYSIKQETHQDMR